MAIRENINSIRKTLDGGVTLIAVSKTKSVKEMQEAYDCGIRDFGENKVQELMMKMDSFGDDVRWHLIGHLQSNKIKYIVGKIALLHSLDSIKLLQELERAYSLKGLICEALIEINIGREESKTGLKIEDLEEFLCALEECKAVKVMGLMAIIPQGDEESTRNYFKIMKKTWDNLNMGNFRNATMKYLSMGMSDDYKIAIQEGSNMVRIGQGIFGARNYNK